MEVYISVNTSSALEVKQKYLRRPKLAVRSKLHSGNLIRGINA